MMDAVFSWSANLATSQPCWRASSVPVGAGMPDFILATYRPEIAKLTNIGDHHAAVLAYLRLVRTATAHSIAERTRRPLNRIAEALLGLAEAKAH